MIANQETPLHKKQLLILLLALGAIPILRSVAFAENALDAEELEVYSPNDISYGEGELEYRSFATQGGQEGYALSASYSPTPRWAAEAYEVYHANPGGALAASYIDIENRFQLTPPGEYWADLGVAAEAEIAQQAGSPNGAEIIPLIEKQIGYTLLTLNVPLEWQYGPSFNPGTDIAYAVKAQYLLNHFFSPAIEAFGEPGVIGRLTPTQNQINILGPAVYGSWFLGARRTINYSLAFLFGLTPSSPRWTLLPQIEFEF